MRTISGFIYSSILGWKINGKFPDIKKSVTIAAPHTSGWDAFIGKLYLNEIGLKYYVLAKKELFTFPLGLLMRAVRAIPIDRKKRKTDYVDQLVRTISKSDEMHIVISPEGTRRKVTRWKKGFYTIAKTANIPVVVVYLDYVKKEMGVKGVITDLSDINSVMQQINNMYKDVKGKFPENFSLEKIANNSE
jgi:1-acyl-sn-glycerol-3-phosphate acyltransferase